jgi:hypothetical protein
MNLKSIEFIKLKDELSKIINEKCNELELLCKGLRDKLKNE